MNLNIKFLNEKAKLPSKAHPSDAGFDLTATSKEMDKFGNVVYGTGIAVSIPEGYVGLLCPRSSVSKKALALTNSIGIIDAFYIGEIKAKFKPMAYFEQREDEDFEYEIGDKFVQLVILDLPKVNLSVTESLPQGERGEKGFGSSDY